MQEPEATGRWADTWYTMSFDSDFGAQIDELGAELVGLLLSQELTRWGSVVPGNQRYSRTSRLIGCAGGRAEPSIATSRITPPR